MRNPLSQKITGIEPSGIRKFFDIVSEMPDAISGKEKNTDRKSNKKTSPQVISLPEVKPINTHNYNPIF